MLGSGFLRTVSNSETENVDKSESVAWPGTHVQVQVASVAIRTRPVLIPHVRIDISKDFLAADDARGREICVADWQ